MSPQLGFLEQSRPSQGTKNSQRPKRCKQDKSPNLVLSALTYRDVLRRNDEEHAYLQVTAPALHSWGAPFIQRQLGSAPGNREDILTPNNVAEELSSKLPSQIGSVAPAQLGLKYGNCVSHYGAAEMVPGELLKVRMGVICCGDWCLRSRKKHQEVGRRMARAKGRVMTKHWRLDETQTRQPFLRSFPAGTWPEGSISLLASKLTWWCLPFFHVGLELICAPDTRVTNVLRSSNGFWFDISIQSCLLWDMASVTLRYDGFPLYLKCNACNASQGHSPAWSSNDNHL